MKYYRSKKALFLELTKSVKSIDYKRTVILNRHLFTFVTEDGRTHRTLRFPDFINSLNKVLGTEFNPKLGRRTGKGYIIHNLKDAVDEVIEKVLVQEPEVVTPVEELPEELEAPLISLMSDEVEVVSQEEEGFSLEFAKTLTKQDKELELYARKFGFELDARKSLKNQIAELEKLVKESF